MFVRNFEISNLHFFKIDVLMADWDLARIYLFNLYIFNWTG